MPRASVRRAPVPVLLSLLLWIPGAAGAASLAAGEGQADSMERLVIIEQAISGMDRSQLPGLRNWAARDPNERVRERSIGALTLLEDREAGAILQRLLAGDPSGRVRRSAAEASGILGLSSLRGTLAERLAGDRDPYVRAECARALGRLPATDGNPLLVSLVTDPSPEVRALSAEAIVLLKPRDFLGPLRAAALQDPSALVRIYAIRGLAEVDPAGSASLFDQAWSNSDDPDLRMEAFRGLLRSGTGEDTVQAGLADADDRVRFLAFRSWLAKRFPPVRSRDNPPAAADSIRLLSGFLSDRLRGIRELAREEMERQGFRVRPSGFGYSIER